jgi:hypothetical protein
LKKQKLLFIEWRSRRRDGLRPLAFSTGFYKTGPQLNDHPFQHLGGIEISPLGTYMDAGTAGYILYPGTNQRFYPFFEIRDGQTKVV